MRIVTKEFLNENSYQSYPIDFRATYEPYSKEDASTINSLLLDMRLTLPEDLATTAFIANIKVTNALVSLIIMGSKEVPYYDAPPTTPTYTSAEYDAFSAIVLATVNVGKSIALRQNPIKLESAIDGVGGWVVFGPGVQNNANWSFNGPASSAIASSAITKYKYQGVKTISKFGFEEVVDGNVSFVGQNGIEVVRSGNTVSIKFSGTSAEVENSLSNYKGECGVRPETNTCLLTPIKTINKIKPRQNSSGLNEIVLVLDSPLYAKLINTTNPNGDNVDNGGFAISSDVALEKMCPPRLAIPEIECVNSAPLTTAKSTLPTIPFGTELLLDVSSSSLIESHIFSMSQQHPTRKNVSVLKPPTRYVNIIGELIYELHVDHSAMQWQAYSNSGPSLLLFGPLELNFNGIKTISLNGVETKIGLGRLNILDRLNLNSVKISVDSADVPEWAGTYTKTYINNYTHTQNSNYSLRISSLNNAWTIHLNGVVVAGGTIDSSGVGLVAQNYKAADQSTKVRYITAAGINQ